MTAMLSRPPMPAAAADLPTDGEGERFVFHDVGWDFYEQILRAVGDRHVFVTYYRGMLEVMSPSYEHDTAAEILALFVRILARELKVPHKGAGSTTLRRRLVRAGLEPDHSFYIRHVAAIIGRRRINLNVHPPPDLAIEVEVSRRLAERVAVYEALRVPELWRYDLERLRVFELQPGGYVERDRSIAFPTLPLDEVHRFVEMSWNMEELEWDKAVRAWARRRLVKPKPRRRRSR